MCQIPTFQAILVPIGSLRAITQDGSSRLVLGNCQAFEIRATVLRIGVQAVFEALTGDLSTGRGIIVENLPSRTVEVPRGGCQTAGVHITDVVGVASL